VYNSHAASRIAASLVARFWSRSRGGATVTPPL
jgi:hypothetical protein